MIEDTPPKGLENVFSGRVGNAKDRDIFRDMEPKHLKPVSALNSNLYKIHPFLQIDRIPSFEGRWIFTVWGLVSARAAEGIFAHLKVRVGGGRKFSAQLPLMPIMSATREDAARLGAVMYLTDQQIKGDFYNYRHVVFEYTLRIIINQEVYDKMYRKGETPGHVHEAFMKNIVEPLEGSKVVAPSCYVSTPQSPPPPALSPALAEVIEVVTVSDEEFQTE